MIKRLIALFLLTLSFANAQSINPQIGGGIGFGFDGGLVSNLRIPAWVPNPANPPDFAVNWTLNQAWRKAGGLTTPTALGITTSRASVKQVVDSNGNWSQIAANVTAVSNLGRSTEEARTNSIRNNSMVGSSNTIPTNWAQATAGGVTFTYGAVATIGGVPYLPVMLTGTANASGNANISMEGATTIAAAYGQTWSYSSFLFASGTVPTVQLNISERSSGGGLVTDNTQVAQTLSSTAVRDAFSATLLGATTAFVLPRLMFNLVNGVNYTGGVVFIGWPQLENNTLINSSVASATVAAGGTGGVTGTAVYSVGGGTGTATTLNVTVSGGVITAINSVASAGSYTVLPPSPAALTYVSGTGTGVTGATVTLTPTNNAAAGFATSPIITSGSAALRAADVTTMPVTVGSAYTLFEAMTPQAPAVYSNNQYVLSIDDGTLSNRSAMYRGAGGGSPFALGVTGGASYWNASLSGSIHAQNVSGSYAISFAPSSQAGSFNNGTVATNASGTPYTASSANLHFGTRADAVAGTQTNGLATKDAIWLNQALQNAQLQALQ